MSSQTQRDQESAATPGPSLAAAPADPSGPARRPERATGGRSHRRWPLAVLGLALMLAIGGGVYLATLAGAWSDHAAEVDDTARELGGELAETRAELEETQGTLALVESQLDAAQEQIHELADTAAQFGDDREVQRQVAEYQSELFTAASGVTGTMSECISSQTEYSLALEAELVRVSELQQAPTEEPSEDPSADPSPEPPEEAEEEELPDLAGIRQEVVDTCQEAAEAHELLQQRLGDS